MSRPRKSGLEKQLDALARQYGATVNVEGESFVLSKAGERNTLRVTEATEDHEIERYLRGSSS